MERASVLLEANLAKLSARGPHPSAHRDGSYHGRGRRIKVTVAHGMAEDHWIQAIWVQTESGEMLKSVELTASDSPCLEMDAPPSGKIVAYEICNLHGVYASEPTEI